MSMSNRLLQNYLDLSLPSKKSIKLHEALYKEDIISLDSKENSLIKKKEFSSQLEINRIPSNKKKNKYSVATIATQVDMNLNSLICERKDFMYRNQELSDVESQILGIEIIDMCNDNVSTKNLNRTDSSIRIVDHSFLSTEKAIIKINDYSAFKNSVRLNSSKHQRDSLFDSSYQLEEPDISAELEIKTDLEHKLIFRFSKSITDDLLKLEQDIRKSLARDSTSTLKYDIPNSCTDNNADYSFDSYKIQQTEVYILTHLK